MSGSMITRLMVWSYLYVWFGSLYVVVIISSLSIGG